MIAVATDLDKSKLIESVKSVSFKSELIDRESGTNVTLWSDDTVSVETFLLTAKGEPLEHYKARYSKQTLGKLIKALKTIYKDM